MQPLLLGSCRGVLLAVIIALSSSVSGNPLNLLVKPADNSPVSTGPQTIQQSLDALDKLILELQKKFALAQDNLAKSEQFLKQVNVNDESALKASTDQVRSLQSTRDKYQLMLDSARDLRRLKVRLDAVLKEQSQWKPPEGEAPWPLLVGDQVLIKKLQLDNQIQFLNQRESVLTKQLNEQKNQRATLEVELRQAQEKGTDDSGPVELAKRKLERVDQDLTSTDLERDGVLTQRQILLSQRHVVEKNWAHYQNRFVFTQESYDNIRQSIESDITRFRAQEQQSSIKINRLIDQSTQAKDRLDQLEKKADTPASEIHAARNAWLTLDAQAAAARIEREKFRATVDLLLLDLDTWNMRYAFYNEPNIHNLIAKFKERQQYLMQRLEQGRRYLNEIISEKSQASFEIRTQIDKSTDPAEKRFLQGMLKPIDEALDNARQVFVMVEKSRQLIELIDHEVIAKESRFSLTQKLDAAWQVVANAGATVWNLEIFAVDDIVVVDGREIKSKRSVTIGKTIGAIFILIIGFMLITRIIRKTLNYAVNRGSLRLSTSMMVGRWLTFIAGATLITFSFTLVQIPLSAFAFLGGALAIGVGFGTQTLLKNLISGLMLQIEKPIRIGDLVEVDGMTGTVTSIGVRYSTIYGPQGTDTLIPNSLLVENKLTNWTYSTPDVRKDIRISVGYDSDPKLVKEILLDIADRQAMIQATPSPIVTLEDFGDNGLLFNLQFWVRIQPGVSAAQVMSEVRFEMLRRLTEAGIELPYPQRVIHMSTDKDKVAGDKDRPSGVAGQDALPNT